jgi:hypothetical protein
MLYLIADVYHRLWAAQRRRISRAAHLLGLPDAEVGTLTEALDDQAKWKEMIVIPLKRRKALL